jgi:hypothetical protein
VANQESKGNEIAAANLESTVRYLCLIDGHILVFLK